MTVELNEREWDALLRELPANADRPAVRAAVEVATLEYNTGASHDEESRRRRKEIKKARSIVEKLLCSINRIQPDRPPEHEIKTAMEALSQFCATSELSALLPSTRRERFLSRLSLAWTGPGKGALTKSETGPFTRFMHAVGELGGRGVKAFAIREEKRRAKLHVVLEPARPKAGVEPIHGQTSLGAVAFLIDATGQRKPEKPD
jgi:hypothetical protein